MHIFSILKVTIVLNTQNTFQHQSVIQWKVGAKNVMI
jgi:hypothetical protein